MVSPDNNPDFSDVNPGKVSSGGPPADFSDVSSGSSTTAPGTDTDKTYTVKSGDTLSKISKHFYGDGSKWKKIHAANADKIPNPDLIYPGQVLTIPSA